MRISIKENMVCWCLGMIFFLMFVVFLNMIDFVNVWGKFDFVNVVVYGMFIVFFVVYVIVVLYFRC